MHALTKTIRQWQQSEKRIALAFAIRTNGSSPQAAGACMVINEDGEFEGSVSGGCIEGNVVQAALQCIESGESVNLEYLSAQEDEWNVSIPCGGEVDVFVTPFDEEVHEAFISALEQDIPFTYIVNVTPDSPLYASQGIRAGRPLAAKEDSTDRIQNVYSWMETLVFDEVVAVANKTRNRLFKQGIEPAKGCTVDAFGANHFVYTFEPRNTLLCVGAVHISEVLVTLAHALNYRTIVVDPRSSFATKRRFPLADEVIVGWPQQIIPQYARKSGVAICALTHDEKIDTPALDEALSTNAFYIGCLGSPETLLDRRLALEELGWENGDLQRIFGPIGLYIGGGRDPRSIALSIMAQIVATQSGRINHPAELAGHTLDFFTPEQVEEIDSKRAVRKFGKHD